MFDRSPKSNQSSPNYSASAAERAMFAPRPFGTESDLVRPKPDTSKTDAPPAIQPQTAPTRPPVNILTKPLHAAWRYGTPPVQAKLTVGQPGDQYEQEADCTAAQVMQMPEPISPPVQREMNPEEELQTKPLAAAITPLVQREMAIEEEELQMKPLPTPSDEEEAIQTKSATKPTQASSDLENQLSASKGGGSLLSDEVRSFMEPRFGADFGQVKVHTDSQAVQMNQALRAQAFTHGSDIYYGSGKSPGKNDLTAHELTHVVQQTGGVQTKVSDQPDVQRKCPACEAEEDTLRRKEDSTAPTIQRAIGDGHDLQSPRFAGDPILEACFDGEQDKYLRRGSSGAAVEKLQQALMDSGFPLPEFGVDGKFGPETAAAVVAFKQSNGIEPSDPVVGPKTMAELDRRFPEPSVPPDIQPPPPPKPETDKPPVPPTIEPNQPPPKPETDQRQDKYEIQIKAWIPHERIVDPEETVRAPIECTGVGLSDPREYTSQYHGDGHPDYPGGMRVLSVIQFTWNGREITEVTHQEKYGLTIRFWACKDIAGQIINQGSESGRATEATRGGIDNFQNSFFLEISSGNPLTMSPAPPIRSMLTGVFNSDGTLHLVSQTTRFPSHGFQVIRDGALVQEQITNDASGVEALGIRGLFNLFNGLTDFSNVFVRDLSWR